MTIQTPYLDPICRPLGSVVLRILRDIVTLAADAIAANKSHYRGSGSTIGSTICISTVFFIQFNY
jgi:hypothetical protein